MRHRVRSRPLHPQATAQRARAAFVEICGAVNEGKRAAEIAALPTVNWRGQRMFTITCNGDFGKGPHAMNVPEHVLWALIDLRAYRCAFH